MINSLRPVGKCNPPSVIQISRGGADLDDFGWILGRIVLFQQGVTNNTTLVCKLLLGKETFVSRYIWHAIYANCVYPDFVLKILTRRPTEIFPVWASLINKNHLHILSFIKTVAFLVLVHERTAVFYTCVPTGTLHTTNALLLLQNHGHPINPVDEGLHCLHIKALCDIGRVNYSTSWTE